MDPFFETFPPVTKNEWLLQVEKELKGKPFEDLQWMIGNSISVDPFYVEEDITPNLAPQVFPNAPKGWKIGENFNANDP
ncbi:MAG: hypothetical protein KDC24_13095, partial [Saprospiraceae bacterium]|nr:hypothetical protein [Saprospiraceae bacterium]